MISAGVFASPAAVLGNPPSADTAARKAVLAERDQYDRDTRRATAAGRFDDAIAAALKMLEIERKALGDDHADADGSRSILAVLYALSDKAAEAQKTVGSMLDRQRKQLGGEHPRVLASAELLRLIEAIAKLDAANRGELKRAQQDWEQGYLLYWDSKYHDALQPLARSAELRRKVLGDERSIGAVPLVFLAHCEMALKRPADALAHYKQAAEIYRQALGGKHPQYAACLHNCGDAARALGALEHAAAAHRQAWQLRGEVLGADDASTRASLGALVRDLSIWAGNLEESGDIAQARKVRQQELEAAGKLYAADDWRLTDVRVALESLGPLERLKPDQQKRLVKARELHREASRLYSAKDNERALVAAEQAYDARREILGADSLPVASSANLLALVHSNLRQYDRARPLLEQALTIWRKAYGPQHPQTAIALHNQGVIEAEAGNLNLGAAKLAEAMLVRRAAYGPRDSDTRDSMQQLAWVLGRQAEAHLTANDLAGAMSDRRRALELQTELNGAQDWRTIDARVQVEHAERLAKLSDAERAELAAVDAQAGTIGELARGGQLEKAVAAAEALLSKRTALLSDADMQPQFARFWLTELLKSSGRLDDAGREADKLLDGCRRILGTGHPAYASALLARGGVLLAQQKFEPAADDFRVARKLANDTQGPDSANAKQADIALLGALERVAAKLDAGNELPARQKAWQEILDLRKSLYGEKDPRTNDAAWALYRTQLWPTLSAAQREQLSLADRWVTYTEQLLKAAEEAEDRLPRPTEDDRSAAGKKAADAATQAVQLRRGVLGDANPKTAAAWELLAECQDLQGDFNGELASYTAAMTIRGKAQGENHPDYLAARNEMVKAYADSRAMPFQRSSKLTPAKQQRLAERDRWYELSRKHRSQGDSDGEQRSVLAMLAIEREVYGDYHDEVARSWQRLAELAAGANDYPQAKQYWEYAGKVRSQVFGPASWQALDARYHVDELSRLDQLSDDDRQRLLSVLRLAEDGSRKDLDDEQWNREVLRVSEQALPVLRRALGENHLYYANCLDGMAAAYRGLGDDDRAQELAWKAIDITARVLGRDHPAYHSRLNQLAMDRKWKATAAEDQGDFATAEHLWEQRVRIQEAHYGPRHWRARNARQDVLHCRRLAGLSPDQRKQLQDVRRFYFPNDPYTLDLPGLEASYQGLAKLLGDDDGETVRNLIDLGSAYRATGDFQRAQPLLAKALPACRRVLGTEHPETARCANELGLAWYGLAEYVKAEPLLLEAREILERIGSNTGEQYAANLNNLAVLYEALGDFDRAEPLLRQVVNIRVPDPEEGEVADEDDERMQDGGKFSSLMGEFNIAMAIRRGQGLVTAPAPKQRDPSELTRFVNNLALVCEARHETAQAESLLRQSLWLARQKRFDDNPSPEYLTGLNNLAAIYAAAGQLEPAGWLLERVVQLRKDGDSKSPAYATALNNLGVIQFRQGDLKAAEKAWNDALRIRQAVLGARHPNTVLSRANLAMLAEGQSDIGAAAQQLHDVLKLAMANLQLAANIQSERQQLLLAGEVRGYLDQYISLAAANGPSAEAVYRFVLNWKGSVSAGRQRLRRSLQDAARVNPKLAMLFAELDQTDRQLAALTLGSGDEAINAEGRDNKLAALAVRKDDLQRQIARADQQLGREMRLESMQIEELKALLPENAALVDLLEYTRITLPARKGGNIGKQRRVAAFVVRRGYPVVQRDLGPADALETLVDDCRKFWLGSLPDAAGNPPKQMRERVWNPLVEDLRGVDTVLISPDGALSRLAWAALPGDEPETYLIEDVALAIVPVPQLLASQASSAQAAAMEAPAMLAVGDVDFGIEPVSPASSEALAEGRKSRLGQFAPLPGTRDELAAIERIYQSQFNSGPLAVLKQSAATETNFRQKCPTAAYLHLATHGFFAPATQKPARPVATDLLAVDGEKLENTSGWNPDLLSGIVLAGANGTAVAGGDDGILTAAEVGDLDLSNAQLVVLSACETGLGQIAGGEGALGLQRAFQVAGARNVVSSLWKVDDEATRRLMAEFYANLWQKRLPTLAAFRQAQLKLLGGGTTSGKTRGLEPEPSAALDTAGGRLPPRLWAAFVVSSNLQ